MHDENVVQSISQQQTPTFIARRPAPPSPPCRKEAWRKAPVQAHNTVLGFGAGTFGLFSSYTMPHARTSGRSVSRSGRSAGSKSDCTSHVE